MTVVQALYGHVSPETAFLVTDYPYGFRLRCKIRYWLEYKPGHGYRFCSQTTNPKKAYESWNAPKHSTYVSLAAGMYLNEQGHVTWTGLHAWCQPETVASFVRDFPQADLRSVFAYAKAAQRHTVKVLATDLDPATRAKTETELAQWNAIVPSAGEGVQATQAA